MNPILIINSAPFTNDFVEPITELYRNKNIKHTLINYNEIPNDLSAYSGIIISASPKGDDIIQEQLPFYQWLKNYNKPIIGSCHGHQLLAVLFGSSIKVGTESEEGMHAINTVANDIILENLPKQFMVEQHHVKSVTLPNNFLLLAKSERCENQIMKHEKLAMYGCQFHIETQPTLLTNFANLCSK